MNAQNLQLYLTKISGLSREAVRRLFTEVPLIAGLSSRPLPRDLPPGVVRGDASTLEEGMDDSMSVKKGCRPELLPKGEAQGNSGTPLLLAGLDCLQQ